MCNKRYTSKTKNKEIRSVSGKTDSPMSLLFCSRFSGWILYWRMDAIPRNPSYSASFSPIIFLLHNPFLISLYLGLNMYISKDDDYVPTFESPWIPPSNHPGSTGAGPWHWNTWICFKTVTKAFTFSIKLMLKSPGEAQDGVTLANPWVSKPALNSFWVQLAQRRKVQATPAALACSAKGPWYFRPSLCWCKGCSPASANQHPPSVTSCPCSLWFITPLVLHSSSALLSLR